MVQINQEICIGCGACMEDCPGSAIDMQEGKAKHVIKCIQCGHCVAVCPVRAVSIPKYDMEDIEEYETESFDIQPQNMLHAIKFRRSIRNYKAKKVGEDKVSHLLDAGRYTATAKNQQGTRFVFVQEQLKELKGLVWQEMPGILEQLAKDAPLYAGVFNRFYEKWKKNPKDDNLFFNAPAFLVIAADNPLDGGLAAANVENMAVSDGLGVLYSGYLMRIISSCPALEEWLELEGKAVACCMLIGYPAVSYKRTAPRKKADIIRK